MVDPQKVKAILSWEAPTNQMKVISFLGLVEYYRWFIRNFSVIVSPMTNLLKKNVEFMWSKEYQRSMDELKKRLTTAAILILPDNDSDFVMYSDASQRSMGYMLM